MNFVSKTTNNVVQFFEEKREGENGLNDFFKPILIDVLGEEYTNFISNLGDSPTILSTNRMNQIKETFPIPKEQNIFWADAEFDLRPSGIVLTEKGVFIRTNVEILDGVIDRSKFNLEGLSSEEQQAFLQHKAQYYSGKAQLIYYSWEDFNTAYFISDSELENKALLVDSNCSKRFIDACKTYFSQKEPDLEKEYFNNQFYKEKNNINLDNTILSSASLYSSESAIFAEQKSNVNTPAGHGEMVEEAITMIDNLLGLDAKVIGRDNSKNGADRLVGNTLIQTKYYNTARGSLEACFNPENGLYRYMNDGKPMQLEVPKDQYQKVLEGFQHKIKTGKVPGVTNPDDAKHFVRKGRLTYTQAVNLTKAGTIESIMYDAKNGAVICSSAFGITFISTLYLTWRKTKNINLALEASLKAGLQIFGTSFLQHILISQISKTNLSKTLLVPSQFVVNVIGPRNSATIVNLIRAGIGKKAIYGSSASKHLEKILRTNTITTAIIFTVSSIPETYNLAMKKISLAQYTKNMAVLAGSMAAGITTGIAAAKIVAAAGTVVKPGFGTAIGLAGGMVGGLVGGSFVKFVGDILHEDDSETIGRMFNAYLTCMINEFLLDENEMNQLIEKLDNVDKNEFKNLFESILSNENQENTIRDFLTSYFEEITARRPKFTLPSNENILHAMSDLVDETMI